MVRSKRGRDSGRDTRRVVGSWSHELPSAPFPACPWPSRAADLTPPTGLAAFEVILSDSGGMAEGGRLQIPNPKPQHRTPKILTPNPRPQTSSPKTQTPNPKTQNPKTSKPQTPNPKPQTPKHQNTTTPKTPKPNPQNPNPKPQIAGVAAALAVNVTIEIEDVNQAPSFAVAGGAADRSVGVGASVSDFAGALKV